MRRGVVALALVLFVGGRAPPALDTPRAHAAIGDDSRQLTLNPTFTLSPGQVQAFDVGFQNTGSTTWTSWTGNYRLLYEAETRQLYRIPPPDDPVDPGRVAWWSITFTAPSTPGGYFLFFRMVDISAVDGGEFGDLIVVSLNVGGSSPTSSPTLPPAATPTSTPTLTPTLSPPPMLTPTPGPDVGVGVTPGPSSGMRQATLAARDAGCVPNNRLQAVQFTRLANATVDVSAPAAVTVTTAPTTVALPSQPPSVVLTVHRVTAGQPTTVELVVTDRCGTWRTFVGGGPGAF